jgi:hypothetical protein
LEFEMIDRQLLGDVALAALIALSGAALAQPDGSPRTAAVSVPHPQPAVSLASAADRQIGFRR